MGEGDPCSWKNETNLSYFPSLPTGCSHADVPSTQSKFNHKDWIVIVLNLSAVYASSIPHLYLISASIYLTLM